LYETVGEKEIILDKFQKEQQSTKMAEAQRAADSLLAKSEKLKAHTKKLAMKAAAAAAKPKPPPRSPVAAAAAGANISTIVLPTAPAVDKRTSPAGQATMQVSGAHDSMTPSGKRGRPAKSPPNLPVSSKKKAKKVGARTRYLGERVAKVFEQEDEMGQPFQEIYFGTIDQYVATSDDQNPLWHVQYDDDDEEEFDEKDVLASLKFYTKEKKNDPNPKEDEEPLQVAGVAASTLPVGKD
jgi:hypothetical protein